MHAEEGFLGLAIDPVDDPAEDCAWIGSLCGHPGLSHSSSVPCFLLTLEPSRKLTRPPIGKTAFLPLADARCSHAGFEFASHGTRRIDESTAYWRAGSIAGSVWSMRLDLGLAYFGGDSAYSVLRSDLGSLAMIDNDGWSGVLSQFFLIFLTKVDRTPLCLHPELRRSGYYSPLGAVAQGEGLGSEVGGETKVNHNSRSSWRTTVMCSLFFPSANLKSRFIQQGR